MTIPATPPPVLCWCCGTPLVARYVPSLRVLECVACEAVSTFAVDAPTVDADIRCTGCHKLIMQSAARPWAFRCPRCSWLNRSLAS